MAVVPRVEKKLQVISNRLQDNIFDEFFSVVTFQIASCTPGYKWSLPHMFPEKSKNRFFGTFQNSCSNCLTDQFSHAFNF